MPVIDELDAIEAPSTEPIGPVDARSVKKPKPEHRKGSRKAEGLAEEPKEVSPVVLAEVCPELGLTAINSGEVAQVSISSRSQVPQMPLRRRG